MKRKTCIIIFSIICLALTAAKIQNGNRVLRVGVYENPPKIFTQTDGTVSGFWPELVLAIAEKHDWQVEWVQGTWEENLVRLQNQEIDVLPDVGWTEERNQTYVLSSETVLVSWARVYVPKGSVVETVLDLEGKKVGGLSGSLNFDGPEGLKTLAKEFHVNCDFVEMASYLEVFEAIEVGEIDAGVTNKDFGDLNEGKYDIARTPIIIQPTSLVFAFSRENDKTPELKKIIDEDLNTFKDDPKSIYYALLEKYFESDIEKNFIEVIPQWVYLALLNLMLIALIFAVIGFTAQRQVKIKTAALSQSEARYRALLENNPDQIIRLNKEGIFLDYHALPGSSLSSLPEGIRGKHIESVFPCDLAQITMKHVNQAIQSNNLQSFEYQTKLDKKDYEFEARVTSNIKDEAIVFIRDINEIKRANQELIESQKRYQNLTNIVPVGIFHTDIDGQTTYVNPTWCQISGMSYQEGLGNGWLNGVHPEDRKKISDTWKKATQVGNKSINDYRFIHQDGSIIWVIGQAVPEFNENNQVIGYVGTITDITERKRVEDLKAAVEKAESADRLKSAFLATMSHELRTPLNSIIGFTGILLQNMVGPLNDEQKKQLNMVQGSAQHLLELINDVLDISKIEAGQVKVFPEDFYMDEAINHSVEKVFPMANKKGLKIFTEISPEKLLINSDKRRLEQILINLLNNAVKFTNTGEIRVVCQQAEEIVTTKVIDSGIGIKAEDLDTLFAPFRQVDTGISRQYEGTGLGLSICKRLVGLLGGELSVESEWGKGSTFSFTLPLWKDEDEKSINH
jgi:PAS domain S-box-containing protein